MRNCNTSFCVLVMGILLWGVGCTDHRPDTDNQKATHKTTSGTLWNTNAGATAHVLPEDDPLWAFRVRASAENFLTAISNATDITTMEFVTEEQLERMLAAATNCHLEMALVWQMKETYGQQAATKEVYRRLLQQGCRRAETEDHALPSHYPARWWTSELAENYALFADEDEDDAAKLTALAAETLRCPPQRSEVATDEADYLNWCFHQNTLFSAAGSATGEAAAKLFLAGTNPYYRYNVGAKLQAASCYLGAQDSRLRERGARLLQAIAALPDSVLNENEYPDDYWRREPSVNMHTLSAARRLYEQYRASGTTQ